MVSTIDICKNNLRQVNMRTLNADELQYRDFVMQGFHQDVVNDLGPNATITDTEYFQLMLNYACHEFNDMFDCSPDHSRSNDTYLVICANIIDQYQYQLDANDYDMPQIKHVKLV